MRSSALLIAGALTALVATGCTEVGPTGTDLVAVPGEAAQSQAPEASGPLVIRFESGFPIMVTFDLADGLLAVYIARDGFAGCGEPFTVFRPARYQDLSSPIVQDLLTELLRAEAFVTVYPWEGEDIEADPCGFLLNTPKIARGTASLLRTDNNLFGTETERANAFGYKADGIIALTSGGLAHFNAISRGVGTPGGGFTIKEDINLVPLK